MAQLFGKQAGLFVPSGTMGNMISLMLSCKEKGDAAVLGHMTHINIWERGNISAAGSVMPVLVQNHADGTLDLDEVEFFCKAADPHHSVNQVLCLESTHNECGGRVIPMDFINKAKKVAKKHKMRMHLDGARCLNSAAYLNISPAEMCKAFDTVTVCLSKGLGCPIGSIIMGTEKDMK